MPSWIAFAIVLIVLSLVAAWIVRRLLDDEVGWLRALVTAGVVIAVAMPVAIWSLTASEVYVDGAIVVAGPVAIAVLALTVGWMLAAVFIVVLTLEFLWPSRRWRNPVTLVREALRRRDRTRRYLQILAIGSRHGLTFYEGRRHGNDGELPSALVSAMNEAGVTFVKLGQVLSTRDDVFPPAMIDALSTLQMDSTPIPWAEAEAAIADQLGCDLADVFAEIDHTPFAAASVAQVHAARLIDGQKVVVKIQRPQARAQVTTDLDILDRLAREGEQRTVWARAYGIHALVEEFSRGLREELDYRTEVTNGEMLRDTIAASDTARLRIPRAFSAYSSAHMIVQERVEGTPFSRLRPGDLPHDRAVILADALVDAVVEQIAVRGIFHADLHPGNVILDLSGSDGGSLTLIDFGAIGIIESSLRRLLLPLLIGMANEDDIAVTDAALLICGTPSGNFDAAALQRDIGVILTRVHNSHVDENIFRALLDVLRRNRIAPPPSLLLVFRTLASLEGTLRKIVPDYDMVGRALQIAPQIARSVLSPHSAMLTAQTWSALLTEQMRRMPRRLESLTRSLDDGSISVQLRTLESPRERGWIEGLLGRVITTAIGIALVITGVLLSDDGSGPMLTGDLSAFAFLGSVIGLGGLLLLLRSLRAALKTRAST